MFLKHFFLRTSLDGCFCFCKQAFTFNLCFLLSTIFLSINFAVGEISQIKPVVQTPIKCFGIPIEKHVFFRHNVILILMKASDSFLSALIKFKQFIMIYIFSRSFISVYDFAKFEYHYFA